MKKGFVKWVGGKYRIINYILDNIPKTYNNYYEPFLGSGCVLFNVLPSKKIFINDSNLQLINCYNVIKNCCNKFIENIQLLDSVICTNDFYYTIRSLYNKKLKNNILDIESAAYFVWLNKHCYNGLYRVNKNNEFNSSWNKYKVIKSIDSNHIISISEYLKNNRIFISSLDFEEFIENQNIQKDDFVYIDSPYLDTYSSYSYNNFLYKDHTRLANICKELNRNGVKLMISNSYNKEIINMYKEFNIKSIQAKKYINTHNTESWKKSFEALITNY